MAKEPIRVTHSTIEDFAERPRSGRYHAVFCDPPYGLGQDVDISALIRAWLDEDEYRTGPGFMNKAWDTLPPPSVWRQIRGLCYPGAVLFAFGGTRTADLLSLSIRLGGWQRFDEILHWSYGSGYPKVYDIGKAVARASLAISEYAHETAWQGHATLLKPAQEPIMCFRAPYDDTYVERALNYGTGALNIDAGRIDGGGYDPRTFGDGWLQDKAGENVYAGDWMRDGRHIANNGSNGRWPANLVLSHLPECRPAGIARVATSKPRVQKETKEYAANSRAGAWTHEAGLTTSGYAGEDGKEAVIEWDCVDGCPVKEISDQSGTLKSGSAPATGFIRNSDKHRSTYGAFNGETVEPTVLYGDTGTAARFFLQSHWAYEILEHIACSPAAFYQAKASKKEKNAGVSGDIQTVGDGRNKAIDNPYQRGKTGRRNTHPTVKPIVLTQWLASLLLPPAEIGERRLLVPYSGSGSEAIGAMLAGWESITAIEADRDYVRISKERAEFWYDKYRFGQAGAEAILAAIAKEPGNLSGEKQLRLF